MERKKLASVFFLALLLSQILQEDKANYLEMNPNLFCRKGWTCVNKLIEDSGDGGEWIPVNVMWEIRINIISWG